MAVISLVMEAMEVGLSAFLLIRVLFFSSRTRAWLDARGGAGLDGAAERVCVAVSSDSVSNSLDVL
jgi:hypothetical protein